ncbi:hypothetical protein [Chryseobacterium vrystaatense]|uniref:hypothetical protein n=1 Tax=Chryseobacterium vrystaatense TaxID=307480 RepID=UPI00068F29E5|nr:hypothetical protein [Chryseobacterium vrystaatense]
MNDLTTKANGANKVTLATDTTANAKNETKKNDVKPIIFDTTAEKRIKNNEHFQQVCKKYSFLKEKSDELSAYAIGRDGIKETVKIKNADSISFEISNSVIIGKILNLCQAELYELVEKSEKEVLEFIV